MILIVRCSSGLLLLLPYIAVAAMFAAVDDVAINIYFNYLLSISIKYLLLLVAVTALTSQHYLIF
jgi:hypothetical protein